MIEPALINRLLEVTAIEEVWDIHTRKMAEFGFDRLLYGCTRFRTATSLGDPDDFVVLTNHDRAFVDGYVAHQLYVHAPMVRWSMENDGPCSWSVLEEWLARDEVTEAQRRVLDFNRLHDVTAGYSISFKSARSRVKAAIALTARPDMTQPQVDALWQRDGDTILALNNLVHLCIQSLPYEPPKRSLTKRQREVLSWVGDGKTVQDIAVVMKLNHATVEKHLRLARRSLNVETTAQAVLKASFQNQIFFVD